MRTVESGAVIAGKYRLLELLGEGGMGTVWIAENETLQKRVALKVMKSQLELDAEHVTRFVREAIAASRVRHPAIIETYDAGTDDGLAWIAMELLAGESLSTRLRRQLLSLAEVQTLLLPVIDALGSLHDAGVVHRDLKPENVFLESGPGGTVQPKLLDFGIAKQIDVTALTKAGLILGTPHYLSPEQARGATELDLRSDIYAVGVLLFVALSGATPFEARSLPELVVKMFTEAPRDLRVLASHVPRSLTRVIEQCLAVDPDARPQTTEFLRRAILAALADASAATPGKARSERTAFENAPTAPHGSEALAPRPPLTPAPAPLTTLTPNDTGGGRWTWLALSALVAVVAIGAGVLALVPREPPPEVYVVSTPEGAIVSMDGRQLGPTPVTITEGLEVGHAYQFELAYPGYQPWHAVIEARAGSIQQSAILAALPASLHVDTIPQGGLVVVGGSPRGTAPVDVSGFLVGQTVEVRASRLGPERSVPVVQSVVLQSETTAVSIRTP